MSTTGWSQQQGWGAPAMPPAPPAQPHATEWSAPTHPGPKTSTLALLAILASALGTTVLLGLGSIAGIVLGAIALGQLRRTGEDGRLLAIWAILLGAVTIVALTFSTVVGIGLIISIAEQLSQLPMP